MKAAICSPTRRATLYGARHAAQARHKWGVNTNGTGFAGSAQSRSETVRNTALRHRRLYHPGSLQAAVNFAVRPTLQRVSAIAGNQWNGNGADFTMFGVGRFHDELAAAPSWPGVFNGEGTEYSMLDVERFHEEQVAQLRRGPDPSQYNGEGSDYGMADVERFALEAAKDRAVRRK